MPKSLQRFLEKRSGLTFGLVESGGNYGDRLIYGGAKSLFESKGLSTQSKPYYHPKKYLYYSIRRELNERLIEVFRPLFQIPSFDNVDVIGIHGGANVNDLWGHGITILRTLLELYPDTPLIILPHTFWFTETDFASIFDGSTQPVHLFCREEYSYTLLQNLDLPKNVSTYLSQDTAFYLKPEQLREQATNIDAEPGYDLLAFRDDRESVFPKSRIKSLRSKSERYVEGDISDKSTYSYGQFLGLVDQAGTVYTDRLHVGILAHLLETPAVLYENAYFKTRGVYHHSLADSDYVEFDSAI